MSVLWGMAIDLGNLEGQFSETSLIYLPRDLAYERLKEHTGQDFGWDASLWRAWLLAHGEIPPSPTANLAPETLKAMARFTRVTNNNNYPGVQVVAGRYESLWQAYG
jgi:hypothetical protein